MYNEKSFLRRGSSKKKIYEKLSSWEKLLKPFAFFSHSALAEGGDSDDEMEEVPEVREIEETPHRIGDGRLPKGTLANFLNEFKKEFFNRLDNFDERWLISYSTLLLSQWRMLLQWKLEMSN